MAVVNAYNSVQNDGELNAAGCRLASAHVDVGDLDCVVSVAEPVPGRDVRLYAAGRVGCSGAEGVSADVGRLPVERPILPLVWTFRGVELRRVPVSLAGEADVHVGYLSGA